MKKQLLLLVTMMLPMVASSHIIEVKNADGVTIYYKYNPENSSEVIVTYRGSTPQAFENEYQGDVVIPEEIEISGYNRKVVSISDEAFKNCTDLTSVTIPNSVTSIGYCAFYRCTGLTSVTIPNSVTSIGGETFRYCSSLTSVTIPNSVTSIPMMMFQHCTSLTSVIIPNSVTSIGDDAFGRCSNLTSVTIPNSVTSIGAHAFDRCSSLTSINIPNGLTKIDDYTFNGCTSLTSVTIPNSVTSIGYCAFDGIPFNIIVSQIENPFIINEKTSSYRTFSQNTFDNAILYVPVGTIKKYKGTDGWKDFSHIVEGNSAGLKSAVANQQEAASYYGLDGKQIDTPNPGSLVIKKIGGKSVKVVIK